MNDVWAWTWCIYTPDIIMIQQMKWSLLYLIVTCKKKDHLPLLHRISATWAYFGGFWGPVLVVLQSASNRRIFCWVIVCWSKPPRRSPRPSKAQNGWSTLMVDQHHIYDKRRNVYGRVPHGMICVLMILRKMMRIRWELRFSGIKHLSHMPRLAIYAAIMRHWISQNHYNHV